MPNPIKEPLQARSRATANQVLDALYDLLRQKDLAAISIQELARASGASVSSIYARFQDKHAMVLALHERLTVSLAQELTAIAQRPYAEMSLLQVVEAVLTDFLAFARRHQHVYRAAILSADPLIYQRVVGQIRLASQLCFSWLQVHPLVSADDLEQRVDFAVRALVATLQQTWVMGTQSPSRFELSDAELVRQLGRMAMAYLLWNGDPDDKQD
jgi:AcrR family transcriptional regulator